MFTITIRTISTSELKTLVELAERYELEYAITPGQIHLYIPNTEKLLEVCQALHDKP